MPNDVEESTNTYKGHENGVSKNGLTCERKRDEGYSKNRLIHIGSVKFAAPSNSSVETIIGTTIFVCKLVQTALLLVRGRYITRFVFYTELFSCANYEKRAKTVP